MRFLVKLCAVITALTIVGMALMLVSLFSGSTGFGEFITTMLGLSLILLLVGGLGSRLWAAMGAPDPDDW